VHKSREFVDNFFGLVDNLCIRKSIKIVFIFIKSLFIVIKYCILVVRRICMDKDSKEFLLNQACDRLKKAIQANSASNQQYMIAKKSATMYIVRRGKK
jgi:hypothetical protein